VKPGAPNAHPFPRPANIGKLFAYRGKHDAKKAAKRAQDRKMALLKEVDTHRAAEEERAAEARFQESLLSLPALKEEREEKRKAGKRRQHDKAFPPSTHHAAAA
jgi:hypothetical protein